MKIFLITLILLSSLLYAHVVTPEMFAEMNKRLERNPQDVEAIMICSHYHENEKMYDKAIEDIHKIITIMNIEDPGFQPALFIRLAQLYVNNSQYENALQTFNKLLTKEYCEKNNHLAPIQHAILWRGKIYAELGKYEEAWQDVQLVLTLNQDMPVYFVEAAKIAEKTNDTQKAFSLYEQAATKFPTPESEPFVVHAISLVVDNDANKTIAFLQNLAQSLPLEPYPYFYIAIIAKDYLKDEILFVEAKQNFISIVEKMKESDPCGSYFWQAKMAYTDGLYQEALTFLDEALSKDVRPSAIYQLQAKIYQKIGSQEKEQKSLQKYIEMQEKFSYQWLYWCEMEKSK